MKPHRLALILLLFASYLEASNAVFIPKDLSDSDELLFTCETEQPGWGMFQTAFRADLTKLNTINNEAVSALTYFPEQTAYYADSRELEILNRFGLFRVKLDNDMQLYRLDMFSTYRQGRNIPEGSMVPAAASPDGKWILVQEAEDGVRGSLYLCDARTGKKVLISNNHVLVFKKEFAAWSADSRYVIYSRDTSLYYMDVGFMDDSHVPDESYREFGNGKLANVRWVDDDALYYLTDSLVTIIRPSELFTRTFYSNPLPAGETVGRIPIDFDPNLDSFWPSPDGNSLMLLKGGQTLFLIPLELSSGEENGKSLLLPYLRLPKQMTLLQFWWQDNGDITVLAGGNRHSVAASLLYRMDADKGSSRKFELQNLIDVRQFVPSPDATILAVLEDEGVSMRGSDDFKEIKYINHPDPRSLHWVDMNRILISGGRRIESVLWESDVRDLITLSTADEVGFDLSGNIIAENDGRRYQWKVETSIWKETSVSASNDIRSQNLNSKSLRIYDKVLSSSFYANQIMVRSIRDFGNRTLLNVPELSRTVPENIDDDILHSALDNRVFDHGSRMRRREIAMVFNAIDTDEGIGEILNVLADYDIQATFFVGGDFLRQNQETARILASTHHEIGSLFFTHMDMADYRYRIDKNFVIRGLGRNEDEYFRVTNREISTLWHAPWYVVSPPVLDATQSMSYLYVGRDIDPLDWVVFDSPESTRELYRPSIQIVERILNEVKPGSIVPIRIGKPGNREDYLFNDIELLINGLIRDGYDIVTVGKLKEHSL